MPRKKWSEIVKINDYIQGARHGVEAHDAELEAMLDPLVGDALDGFDAVAGDHSAALTRLAGKISSSAAAGKASARARASHLGQQRLRGWSMAVAAVFLAAATVGTAWLLDNDNSVGAGGREGEQHARENRHGWSDGLVEPTLPPVTVIPNDPATPAAPSNPAGVALDPDEIRSAPAADTVVTPAFRAFVASNHGSVFGRVVVSFNVDHKGRPQSISLISSASPEASSEAIRLLEKGPDWPSEHPNKLIVIDL
jgi:hypothetical protein